MVSESAFGINVPGGSPAALNGASDGLRAVSGSLERVALTLRDTSTAPWWTGVAKLQFANRLFSHADVMAGGSSVLQIAAQVVSELASKLEAVKRATGAAVEDAKQADTRRDTAEREMESAKEDARAAQFRAMEAERAMALSSALGTPDMGADANRSAALQDAAAAEQRAAGAQRARERALADLEDAQRAGNKAVDEYREACRDAANQLSALIAATPQAVPVTGIPVGAVGGPGAPILVAPIGTRTGGLKPATDSKEDEGGGALGTLGDIGHGILDVGGFFPALGAIPDGVNAGWYALEGDRLNAGISLGAAVPLFGDAGKAGKIGSDVVGGLGRGGDDVVKGGTRYGPATDPGPLGNSPKWDEFKDTFRSGSYTARTYDQPQTLYRVYGGGSPSQLSHYWTPDMPKGRLQAHVDMALPNGNTAERIVTIEVPPGVERYEGIVAENFGKLGGAHQTVITRVQKSWILSDNPFP
jgi:hypothetical protein